MDKSLLDPPESTDKPMMERPTPSPMPPPSTPDNSQSSADKAPSTPKNDQGKFIMMKCWLHVNIIVFLIMCDQ